MTYNKNIRFKVVGFKKIREIHNGKFFGCNDGICILVKKGYKYGHYIVLGGNDEEETILLDAIVEEIEVMSVNDCK